MKTSAIKCPTRQEMKDAGLPTPIRAAVLRGAWRGSEADVRMVARAQRFVQYWQTEDRDEEVKRAWSMLAAAARWKDVEPGSESFFRGMTKRALVHLFESMPDRVEDQPFERFFGRRHAEPEREVAHYKLAAKLLRELVTHLKKHSIDQRSLSADLQATPGTAMITRAMRASFQPDFLPALDVLATSFEAAAPMAKYFTRHGGEGRSQRTYASRVFALADFLQDSAWQDLARIANANCPAGRVTAQQLKNLARRTTSTAMTPRKRGAKRA